MLQTIQDIKTYIKNLENEQREIKKILSKNHEEYDAMASVFNAELNRMRDKMPQSEYNKKFKRPIYELMMIKEHNRERLFILNTAYYVFRHYNRYVDNVSKLLGLEDYFKYKDKVNKTTYLKNYYELGGKVLCFWRDVDEYVLKWNNAIKLEKEVKEKI